MRRSRLREDNAPSTVSPNCCACADIDSIISDRLSSGSVAIDSINEYISLSQNAPDTVITSVIDSKFLEATPRNSERCMSNDKNQLDISEKKL